MKVSDNDVDMWAFVSALPDMLFLLLWREVAIYHTAARGKVKTIVHSEASRVGARAYRGKRNTAVYAIDIIASYPFTPTYEPVFS